MDFAYRRRKRQVRLTGGRNEATYPHILQFYEIPPIGSITLQEFENFAIERLQVLRIIEGIALKHIKLSEDYNKALSNEFRKQNLSAYSRRNVDEADITDEYYDERRKDHISHFILRLAYCRTENLRRWFISQETDLFRFRINNEVSDSVKTFLQFNKLQYSQIGEEEKQSIISFLVNSTFNSTTDDIKKMGFFKVHFTEVLDLVCARKVYLRNGYAYIPSFELKTVITNLFRMRLSHALAVTARSLPEMEEDYRLLSMLKTLNQRYLGDDYNSAKSQTAGKITGDMIDNLSKLSFPLCMKNLHEAFRQNHHLRHGGRMQYGLFLKGIGMGLEDALNFWRKEFTRVIDIDKFDKQYAYSIRHNYGKEGKRANYTPYSCMKIIMSNQPGPGDSHGCPFKHFDRVLLCQRLQSLNFKQNEIQEIRDLVEKGHYQIACTRYFEITQKTSCSQAINHPNRYFEESQKIRSDGSTEQNVKLTTTRSQIYMKSEDNMEALENNYITEEEMDEMLNSAY